MSEKSAEVQDASSQEELLVYTSPSRWITASAFLSERPYQRILKFVTPEGVDREATDIGMFDFAGLDERTVPTTPELSRRLLSFADEYLAGRKSGREAYNCHRFALWMSGIEAPDDPSDPYLSNMATNVISEGEKRDGSLALGEMGVIGYSFGQPSSIHSVLGLGEDQPECLQVMGIDGYLGIDTYENRLADATAGSQTPPGFGLYAASSTAQ